MTYPLPKDGVVTRVYPNCALSITMPCIGKIGLINDVEYMLVRGDSVGAAVGECRLTMRFVFRPMSYVYVGDQVWPQFNRVDFAPLLSAGRVVEPAEAGDEA